MDDIIAPGPEPAILRKREFQGLSFIPPPDDFNEFRSGQKAYQSSFTVDYSNGFTRDAREAFQYAVDIWSTLIVSSVPITIQANWTPLPPGTLGSAGPNRLVIPRGLDGQSPPGDPQPGLLKPIALANKMRSQELAPGVPNIVANFNSTDTNWYFGIDGRRDSTLYDLVTVVLHEIGHGLGLVGSVRVDEQGRGMIGFYINLPGQPPVPLGYDSLMAEVSSVGVANAIVNWRFATMPSPEFGQVLRGGNIYCSGRRAVAANGHVRPKIQARAEFEQGSSFSHLDEDTFPFEDPNSLMTPGLGPGEVIHNPGLIAFAMLLDMGW